MPATEDDRKAIRRRDTLESAAAFIDDIDHIKGIIGNNNPSTGDIRRLSAQLRRLLVEKDAVEIAAPRVGQLSIIAPDLAPIYRSDRNKPLPFFVSGNAKIFGLYVGVQMIDRADRPRPLADYSPDATISLKLDNYLNQRVICMEGQWINRRELVKYIANVAHGVHSGRTKNEIERLIRRIRHAAWMKIDQDMPTLSANLDVFSQVSLPPLVDPKGVDCVLLELFATAYHFVNSPDVIELVSFIEGELDKHKSSI